MIKSNIKIKVSTNYSKETTEYKAITLMRYVRKAIDKDNLITYL